jgi:hypothetical protein
MQIQTVEDFLTIEMAIQGLREWGHQLETLELFKDTNHTMIETLEMQEWHVLLQETNRLVM